MISQMSFLIVNNVWIHWHSLEPFGYSDSFFTVPEGITVSDYVCIVISGLYDTVVNKWYPQKSLNTTFYSKIWTKSLAFQVIATDLIWGDHDQQGPTWFTSLTFVEMGSGKWKQCIMMEAYLLVAQNHSRYLTSCPVSTPRTSGHFCG